MSRFDHSNLCLVVLLLCAYIIQGYQICDLKDVECLTRGATKAYKNLLAGTYTKPIDPLHIDQINGNLKGVKYEITNATLSGFRKCEVLSLKLFSENISYDYQLLCPELIFDYFYEAEGSLGNLNLNGKGVAKLTLDNYLIKLKGTYKKFISEKDQNPYLTIQNSNVDTDLRGRLTFETKKLIVGDKAKADLVNKYFNDNYKESEKVFRDEILAKYLAIFAEAVNIYLTTVPLYEVIPRD